MFLELLKKTVLLSTVLTISGCTSFGLPSFGFGKKEEPPKPIPVEIKTVEVKIPITHPAMPRAITLRDPKWYVVSEKNFDEFVERTRKENNGGIVFIAMSVGDYELMAYNMQELRRYINQLKEVVVYYRDLDAPPKEEKPNEPEDGTGKDAVRNP
jgi:hypothetical protein